MVLTASPDAVPSPRAHPCAPRPPQAGIYSYVHRAGLQAYLAQPIAVAHVETLDQDAHRIYHWLGCNASLAAPPVPLTHDSYPGKNDTALSSAGEAALRRALAHDYHTLRQLEAGLWQAARAYGLSLQPQPYDFAASGDVDR